MREEILKLIEKAGEARRNSISTFSGFAVGAALSSLDGRIFSGCNIENVSFGLTICAERVAIFKALSEGVREFSALAIATEAKELTTPCGACRQIIWEFCGDIQVIVSNKVESRTFHTHELFPHPFDSESLGSKS
jgi:cytidine deaminase